MSILGDYVVTGSEDHGLRVYDLNTAKLERQLFNKKYGHSEWVTTCEFLSDGRILSGSMDSMLCLWDAEIVMCDYLVSHTGAVTKVMVDEYNIAASSSYDHTLIIWDLTSKSEAMKLTGPHKSPVLEFDWHNSLLVSGDKDGYVAFWDINEGKPFKVAKAHTGGVSQVRLFSDSMKHHLVITAGISDGVLCIHDMRTNELVYSEKLHDDSINSVKVNLSNMIITASSDNTIKLVDIWGGFRDFGTMQATSPIYCVEPIHNLTIAGAGDGNVLAFDNDTLECLYGFGAMETGAVRCMKITDDKTRMVVGGDDLSPIIMYYV